MIRPGRADEMPEIDHVMAGWASRGEWRPPRASQSLFQKPSEPPEGAS